MKKDTETNMMETINKVDVLMISIKALLTGLTGFSLCMANISGIVTDTGANPIAGVVVHLEKGGQSATTGSDGSFTIIIEGTDILPNNGSFWPNGLSAKISGNFITITIVERKTVEVTTYNLNGKALSVVRTIMAAGRHSLLLPKMGTGIYLYKVKVGNCEFVMKGNSVCGASSVGSRLHQGSSSNLLPMQAKATAVINDVIAAMKTGYLNYRCVQYNSDTTGVNIKMISSAGMVTDADGNEYQTVRIGNQVWTAENLRTTKYNDGSPIPNLKDQTTWDSSFYTSNDAYCYYNNTTNADSIKKFGALYNWYAVNTGKLAPAGWHVPNDSEWTILEKYLVLNGYNWDDTRDTGTNNKIAKSMAAMESWESYNVEGAVGNDLTKNDKSGFSALPGGARDYDFGGFYGLDSCCCWWSATNWGSTCTWNRKLSFDQENLLMPFSGKNCGFSVRLILDSN